jgi:hypothetical protein
MRTLGLESEDILNICICIKSDTKERGAGNASIVITPTNYRSTGPVPAHRIFGYRWLSLVWGNWIGRSMSDAIMQRYNAYIQDNLAFVGTYSLLVRRGRKACEEDRTSTSD